MKKKILFINGHLNVGGVEKSLVDVLRNMNYDQFDVELLLLEELGDYAKDIPNQVHVNLKSLKNTYGSLGKCLLRCIKEKDWFSFRMRLVFLLMKLGKQRKIGLAQNMLTGNQHYDCVIGYRPGICTQIAAFASNTDKRITWWHHGEINVERTMYMEAASVCDYVVTVSTGCKELLEREFPELRSKLKVVPNMVDIARIHQKVTEFYPYKDGVHIVSIGRLTTEKHFENAVSTASILKKDGYRFQWHIVGDGVKREILEELIRDKNVSDCVILEGSQVNPYPYMKWADLFVHPSYVESQGIAILEALSLNVPCVVTKSVGPCGFIEDGVNGLLTERSAESLTEKVEMILADHALYERIRKNTTCPEQFLPDRVVEQIERLL